MSLTGYSDNMSICTSIRSDKEFYELVVEKANILLEETSQNDIEAFKGKILTLLKELSNIVYPSGHDCAGFILSMLDYFRVHCDNNDVYFLSKDIIQYIENLPSNLSKEELILDVRNHILYKF